MRSLFALSLGFACLVIGRPSHADEVRDAVDAGNRAFIAAFLGGDADAIGQLYTENAELIAPGAPVARGRSAIAAAWKATIATGIKDLALQTAEVESAGDLAYETGTVRIVARDGTPTHGRYVVVWKKKAVGGSSIATSGTPSGELKEAAPRPRAGARIPRVDSSLRSPRDPGRPAPAFRAPAPSAGSAPTAPTPGSSGPGP